MNYLVGKTRGKNGQLLKILSASQNIYEKPDCASIQHDPTYKLEEDEWFKIENFSTSKYCPDMLKNTFNSTALNQIKKADFNQLSFLMAIDNDNFFFQKVTSGQILSKKRITIGAEPKLESSPVVIINSSPDALYDKTADALYFFKLSAISGIFHGIQELHREATQPEVDQFFCHDLFKFAANYTSDKVKIANRKRIAMILERLRRLTPSQKKNMLKYIKPYCKNMRFGKSNVTINDEEELKMVCYGLNERFYTTPFGHEKRIANSVLPA